MNNADLCKALKVADSILLSYEGELIEGTLEVIALVEAYEEDEVTINHLVKKVDQLERTLQLYRRKTQRYLDDKAQAEGDALEASREQFA